MHWLLFMHSYQWRPGKVGMFSHLTMDVDLSDSTHIHIYTHTQTHTFSIFEQQITDEGLITICRGCHRLQSLCVSGCANITDAILHALGQNCPRLRWIHTHSLLQKPLKCFHFVWKFILGSYSLLTVTFSHCPPYPVRLIHFTALYFTWFQESSLIDWPSWSWQTEM